MRDKIHCFLLKPIISVCQAGTFQDRKTKLSFCFKDVNHRFAASSHNEKQNSEFSIKSDSVCVPCWHIQERIGGQNPVFSIKADNSCLQSCRLQDKMTDKIVFLY